GVGRGVAVVLEGIACVCGVWGSGRAAHPGRRRPRTLIDLSVRWSGSGPAQSTRSPRSSPRCTVPPLLHPSIPVILYLWSFSGAEHDHRYKITGGGGHRSGDLGDRPGPVGDLRSRPHGGERTTLLTPDPQSTRYRPAISLASACPEPGHTSHGP